MGNNKIDKIELTRVEDFLKKEHPETFDFKDLMYEYYDHYKENHKNNQEYKDLLKELEDKMNPSKTMGTNVDKWFNYKTLDVKQLGKGKVRFFDCDSWNNSCDLTQEIYKNLWYKNLWEKERCVKEKYGGDTINSFATTFNKYMDKGCFKESYETYKSGKKDDSMENFARYVGCIGNFVLVPKGFNKYRTNFNDYFDKSLECLKTEEMDWFGGEGMFQKYINAFFLWDYVSVIGGEYVVREISNNIDTEERLKCFFCKCNRLILERGKFMVEMLRVANKDSKRYEEIQNYLQKPTNYFKSTVDARINLLKKKLLREEDLITESGEEQ